jgi:hypothetical protein
MEYQVNRRLRSTNSYDQKPNHSDKNPMRRITWLTGSTLKRKVLNITKREALSMGWCYVFTP